MPTPVGPAVGDNRQKWPPRGRPGSRSYFVCEALSLLIAFLRVCLYEGSGVSRRINSLILTFLDTYALREWSSMGLTATVPRGTSGTYGQHL